MAEVTDKALPNTDLFGFWNQLLRSGSGGYTADDYFDALLALGAATELVEALRSVPAAPGDDAVRAIARAMTLSGLAAPSADGKNFDGNGQPTIVLP